MTTKIWDHLHKTSYDHPVFACAASDYANQHTVTFPHSGKQPLSFLHHSQCCQHSFNDNEMLML